MQHSMTISSRLHPRRLLCLLALSAACADTQGTSSDGLYGALAAEREREQGEASDAEGSSEAQEALALEALDCPRGGATAPIAVAFACDEITVVSCKDLSNVVLELADGSRQRFEGLHGQQGVFAGTGALEGVRVVGVWVKAGANHSGDGPGYGQRFDAPAESCTPPGEQVPPEDEAPPGEVPPPSDENPPGESTPPSDVPPGDETPPEQGEEPPVVVL